MRLLRISDGTQTIESGGGGIELVVGRSFCGYFLLDCGHVPPRQRKEFVAMAVRRASSEPDPGWLAAWSGDRVLVWHWSESRVVQAAGLPAGVRPKRVLPESLLRGEPTDKQAQLIAMHEGVEGRLWRDGLLVASRWWPAVPALGAWNMFLRGGGETASAQVPDVLATGLRASPWAGTAGGLGLGSFDEIRPWLPVAAVGLLALGFTWQLTALARETWTASSLETAIQAQSAQVGEVIDAREKALADLAATRALLDLRAPRGQLQILAGIAPQLQANQANLVGWQVDARSSLSLTLTLPAERLAALVADLESSGLVNELRVETNQTRGDVVINGRILPPEALQ